MSEQEPCQHLTTNTYCIEGHIIDRETEQNGRDWKEEESYTLNSVDRHGVCTYQQTTETLCASGYDKLGMQEALNDMYVIGTAYDGSQISPTLTANNANGAQRMPDKENFNAVITFTPDSEVKNAIDGIAFSMLSRDYKDPQCVCYGVDCYNQTQSEEVSKALNAAATDSDHIPCVYGLDRASFNQGQNAQYDFSIELEQAQTLVAKGPGGVLATNQAIGGKCEQWKTRQL